MDLVAPGMSGGIAYLYSLDGTFDERNFNMEMIGLEDPSMARYLIDTNAQTADDVLGFDLDGYRYMADCG